MIDYRKHRPVNVNHPARTPQALRAPGDTSVRLLAGQTVVLR